MWTYNRSCTHVVFSGKSNDTNKEYRLAKDHNKLIVSPHWLYACQEQKAHVDESLYPCSYNPSKLPVVNTRTPRSSHNPNVIIANSKLNSTPISNNPSATYSHQLQASQTSTRRAMSTKQSIIKNYVSDEDDSANENSLIESNRVNLRLMKKKPNAESDGMSRVADDKTIDQLSTMSTTHTHHKLNSMENDSEMNLIDSEFLQQCDKHCDNILLKHQADVPDSIDLKIDFLDQLKHKLENINSKNANTSQASLLNEQQALNELNKSKSKWGNSMNDDEIESDDGLKYDANTDGISIKINSDNDSSTKNSSSLRQHNRQTSKKRQYESKGLINNKDLYNDEHENDKNNLYFAQSQIQVTMWNDNDASKKSSKKNQKDPVRGPNPYKS
jgi:hypothetical protein